MSISSLDSQESLPEPTRAESTFDMQFNANDAFKKKDAFKTFKTQDSMTLSQEPAEDLGVKASGVEEKFGEQNFRVLSEMRILDKIRVVILDFVGYVDFLAKFGAKSDFRV